MATDERFTTCLWFDDQGEEAAKFYTSIFKNSKIGKTTRFSEAGQEIHQKQPGSAMTVEFELNGHKFVALNGGPMFKFTEAVSFMIPCETQEEVDYYWEKLTPGGDPNSQQCGWLKDKFGVSWQVVPNCISKMLADPDAEKSQRMMGAMLQMQKLDIAKLKAAFAG